MKRGDLVTVALQGDTGKPRPALIIQSDLATTDRVIVIPTTTSLLPAPFIRIDLIPDGLNNLRERSQLMLDRCTNIKREKVGPAFGRIDDTTQRLVNQGLAVLLGLV